MSAPRHRTDVQDKTPQDLTVDLERKRLYLTLHFVTAEFDYQTGMDFALMVREAVDRIAPDLPKKSTPELHDNGK